jgi:hypothetical protein
VSDRIAEFGVVWCWANGSIGVDLRILGTTLTEALNTPREALGERLGQWCLEWDIKELHFAPAVISALNTVYAAPSLLEPDDQELLPVVEPEKQEPPPADGPKICQEPQKSCPKPQKICRILGSKEGPKEDGSGAEKIQEASEGQEAPPAGRPREDRFFQENPFQNPEGFWESLKTKAPTKEEKKMPGMGTSFPVEDPIVMPGLMSSIPADVCRCLEIGRCRHILRTKTAKTDPERRLITDFINSGLDIEPFLESRRHPLTPGWVKL